MARTSPNPSLDRESLLARVGVPAWPQGQRSAASVSADLPAPEHPTERPSQRNALQGLLAFSALYQQVRRRKALAARYNGSYAGAPVAEFEEQKQFEDLEEELQLIAERGLAITGADGMAIALAENSEIVLRAAAGTVRPDVGARIDRDSAFSLACFCRAQIAKCDDTETDARVNQQACRRLGARSMVAIPLCVRQRVIGLMEAFSAKPSGFDFEDVRNLNLLAELALGALKPEGEGRFAESARVATTKLEAAPRLAAAHTTSVRTQAPQIVPAAPVVHAQPLKAAVTSTRATAILGESAFEAEKAPQFEQTVGTKTAAKHEARAEEAERATRPSRVLVGLMFVAIAAAGAAGVWWKLRTAPSGSVTVRTEKLAPEPIGTGGTKHATAARSTLLSKFPRITGIRHWSSADSSTVVVDLEDRVQYEAHRVASPDRIYFDLHDTQLAPDLAGKSIQVGDALLKRIRVAQPVAGTTRVVLETTSSSTFSVSLEPNPHRLVIELREIAMNPKGAMNLLPNGHEAEKNKLAIVGPPPPKTGLRLKAPLLNMHVVVESGHGGWLEHRPERKNSAPPQEFTAGSGR